MSTKRAPADYFNLPLELWSVRDLTDALGLTKSAALLSTSLRTIYTTRNKSILSAARLSKLIDAVRADEMACRGQLVAIRNRDANRITIA